MEAVVRWSGRLLVTAGVTAWLVWLIWRAATLHSVSGAAVLVLEVVAFSCAFVISAALWRVPARTATATERRATRSGAPLPQTARVAFGLDEVDVRAVSDDDTGEVAWAKHGVRSLRSCSSRHTANLGEVAAAVVSVEGMRRMVTALALVAVLFTGRFPFDVPAWSMIALIVGAQLLLTLGHFLLSDGLFRPGARLRWSMASVGAGWGDGTSRSGLPIRWAATLATMIALNLAIALRGVSDRWTHGLGAMQHDERVVAMGAAVWLVVWGFVALGSLTEPTLGYYGATRRLEEASTRRLALGATLAVAGLGLVAGSLPGAVPG